MCHDISHYFISFTLKMMFFQTNSVVDTVDHGPNTPRGNSHGGEKTVNHSGVTGAWTIQIQHHHAHDSSGNVPEVPRPAGSPPVDVEEGIAAETPDDLEPAEGMADF